MFRHVVAQIVPDPVGVGRREQPLHPVRARLTSPLSQRPTVLPLQRRKQATQIGRHPLTRGSDRENRGAIRACTSSRPAGQTATSATPT